MKDGILDKKYAIERKSKKYLQFRLKQRALVAARSINKYLDKKPEMILDIGSAEGLSILELSKHFGGVKFLGVEYDQGLVKSAPHFPPNISLKQGDICNLNMVETGTCDAVTGLAVFEHLHNPIRALKEAHRVLRPGGIFVATSPNPFWDKIATFATSTKFGGDHHETDISKNVMSELLKETGFDLIEYTRFMNAPVSFLPYLNVSVDPGFVLKLDYLLNKTRILSWLHVNQLFVARKI